MSILQTALESRIDEVQADKDEKLIVMKGPLSELIHRALNIVYNKDGEEAIQHDFALESIAQDVVIAQNLIESVSNDNSDRDADYVLYGINKQDVEPETLVEVKSILEESSENTEVIVMVKDTQETSDLIDNPIQSNMNGSFSAMTAALESLVEQYPNARVIIEPTLGQSLNKFLNTTFGV